MKRIHNLILRVQILKDAKGQDLIEYALMAGINDSPAAALELAQRLQPLLCHVNVIPLNPIPDSPYQPTSDADTQAFVEILREHGVPATVRLRRGIEINAGCGQLRRAVQN